MALKMKLRQFFFVFHSLFVAEYPCPRVVGAVWQKADVQRRSFVFLKIERKPFLIFGEYPGVRRFFQKQFFTEQYPDVGIVPISIATKYLCLLIKW